MALPPGNDTYSVDMRLTSLAETLAKNNHEVIANHIKEQFKKQLDPLITELANTLADQVEASLQHMVYPDPISGSPNISVLLQVNRREVPRRPKAA